jgi:hypothetical protein
VAIPAVKIRGGEDTRRERGKGEGDILVRSPP